MKRTMEKFKNENIKTETNSDFHRCGSIGRIFGSQIGFSFKGYLTVYVENLVYPTHKCTREVTFTPIHPLNERERSHGLYFTTRKESPKISRRHRPQGS